MTSLGTLELQLTANQAALYQQLNNTRTYATQVAKDIEKQINQAFGSVGGRNSLAGLNQATAQAASAGQAAGRTFTDRFKNAVEPIKGILSNVFNGVFVGAGIGAFNSITGVVGSALGAVQQFAGEIFNVTKDFQGFESSLKTFLKGNQKEIDDFVGKLEKFAATTPFELKELQQGAIQNLATGAKPDQIIKDLKTIGDVAAGANARLGDLMEVYAKSRTEGRLQNEDIDQFTGRGVQLRAELAKMLGAKEDEIRQLATDGKLEFRHLEEALRRMSAEGGAYFGAMENKAKTLEGRLSNVQDTFYQFQKSIGVAFEPIMNFIVQTFGDIVSGLTSSNGIMKDVRKESEKLVEAFKANPQLVQSLNKAIQELVAGGFKLLLDGITNFTKYLETNPNIIKDMSTAFNDFWGVVKGVFDGLKFIFDGIKFAVEGIQAGARGAADIWVASEPTLNNIWQKTVDISKAIADGIIAGWNTCVDLVKSLIELIQSLFNGVVNLTTNGINLFNTGLKTAVSVTKIIGENIGGWASNIGSAIQKAGEFASQGIPGIGSAFEKATKKAEEFWKWATGDASQATNPAPVPQINFDKAGQIIESLPQFQRETLLKPTPAPASKRGYGVHKHPIYGDMRMHNGQDFPDPEGTPIKAPLSGRIITAKEDRSKKGAGTIIELETITAEGQKIVNRFFHLSALLKQVGDVVKQGEIIGKVGSTGGSTGPHTHWEVSLNGKRIDPMSQLGKSFNLGKNPIQQGVKQFFTPAQNALPKTPQGVKQFFTPAQNALPKTPQSNDFISQVVAMSDRLGINPEDLIKVMMFETGGTFSPKKHPGNRLSATGLIGFTRDNEKELGISLEKLAKLSQTEQLKYVEKYLKIHSRGKALDTYQKVVSTVFHGNPDGSLNVGDGNITLGGYMKKAESRYGGTARDLVANARSKSTSQPPQTPQQSPQIPGSATGGNAEDQRNLAASRRKIAESKYNEIKGEIEAATTQADNAQKQQRELDTKRREALDKQKQAEFAANEALAPNDAAKKNIQEKAKLYEISNRYNEDLIKKNQELNYLEDARSTKLKILAEAKKRGETVSPSDAGIDYSKSINQLKWVIDETKELRDIELATYDLNQFNAEKEVEKNKDRQREIERLSRAHEAYINQLRLEQSLADDATKQNIQSKIDKAQIEHQAKITLMPLQNQLNDLQGQKVYLLGKGGLKADSDQVRGLQKDIDELVATINAIADKSGVDLKIFENQGKQIELQNQRLKESVLINSKASSLSGQARLIRGQGGNEYKASALEAEAATMQEQLRYKQELLQIEQQIAAVKGTANEYTEQEIATLQANAEAINEINLEGISQQVKTLGKDLLDISKNALVPFFGDIISGSKSAGDAFRDLVGNIAQQLTQLAVNSLISSIFSGGFFGGGEVLAEFQGGIIPNYASGGAVAEALHRERSMSGGKTPVLAALTPGEMVLTIQQTKRFQELRLDKVLNFANGGVVGGGQNLSNEIGSKNTTINIPVNVEGGGNSSVDVPRLENSLRSVILAEIQKQQRPGGALNR